MLNKNIHKNQVNINATGGTLLKNHSKSFFKKFHLNSRLAGEVFARYPKLGDEYVTVLQAMLCGDGEILCEIVLKKDFEKDI